MASEQTGLSVCYSVRTYFKSRTFFCQISARVVSLFMHQNVLVSLTTPSGLNKVLFVALQCGFINFLVTQIIKRGMETLHKYKMTYLTSNYHLWVNHCWGNMDLILHDCIVANAYQSDFRI